MCSTRDTDHHQRSQVFAIGAATVMAQRPSLDADSLHGSGIINLSRVSKFRDGSRTSNSDQGFAQPGAVPAPANADAANSGGSHSNSAAGQPGRIEVAAEHAAAAAAEAAQRHAPRESSPGSEAVLAAMQAAAAVEPPEWFIRWACNAKAHAGRLPTCRWWLQKPDVFRASAHGSCAFHFLNRKVPYHHCSVSCPPGA
jgi:hypothetical protein